MALVKCPECGKENISDKAVACPICAFPIREHFSEVSVIDNIDSVVDDCQVINLEAEIDKLKSTVHRYYISNAKRWYYESRRTFDHFYAPFVSIDQIANCNDAPPKKYEVLDYFCDTLHRIDASCKGVNTYETYEAIVLEVISNAKNKAGSFFFAGCMTYLLQAINYEKLSKGAIISIARIVSTDCMFTIWTRNELDVIFRHLNHEEKQQCMLFWGNRYKFDMFLRMNSRGMYKAWTECKEKGLDFSIGDIERFKDTDVGNIPLPITDASINTNKNANVPKCPTCSSARIHKISTMSKVGSVALWGVLSRKVHKQWHCDSCGSEW